ncbi:MAG: hypothetical protein K2K49_02410, partial [Duncaniella sp.]|nr:hypothetical protein [Duncaniella sp.]
MKLNNLLSAGVISVIMLAMASCSKGGSEILDTIPAEAPVVAVIDAKALCNDCGITLSADGFTADPAIDAKIEGEVRTNLTALGRIHESGAADLTATAIFMTPDKEVFCTFAISGFEAFRDACGERVEWGGDAEGMHVGTIPPSSTLVASDTQVWISDLSATKAPAAVKKLVAKAHDNPLGALSGVGQWLRQGGLANIVSVSGDAPRSTHKEAQAALWNTGTLTSDTDGLHLDVTMMTGDGERRSVPGLVPINPAVLGYAGDAPRIALAFGVGQGFDWSVIQRLVSLSGDFSTMAMFSTAMPYLSAIDGTVMMAAQPFDPSDAGSFDPASWQYTLMAHMPQQKIDEVLGTVRTMCFSAGISPETVGEGVLRIRQFGG